MQHYAIYAALVLFGAGQAANGAAKFRAPDFRVSDYSDFKKVNYNAMPTLKEPAFNYEYAGYEAVPQSMAPVYDRQVHPGTELPHDNVASRRVNPGFNGATTYQAVTGPESQEQLAYGSAPVDKAAPYAGHSNRAYEVYQAPTYDAPPLQAPGYAGNAQYGEAVPSVKTNYHVARGDDNVAPTKREESVRSDNDEEGSEMTGDPKADSYETYKFEYKRQRPEKKNGYTDGYEMARSYEKKETSSSKVYSPGASNRARDAGIEYGKLDYGGFGVDPGYGATGFDVEQVNLSDGDNRSPTGRYEEQRAVTMPSYDQLTAQQYGFGHRAKYGSNAAPGHFHRNPYNFNL